nr:thioredoxin [Anaerolineae bacterium]
MAQTPALLLIRDSQEIARVKSPTPTDIQDYVLYLLGRGPKPVRAETQPADRSVDSSPIAVTDKTFTQVVLESPVPVLVDFWAPWCGPCQIVAPILEKLSGEFAGKLRVAKVNVDENPHYAGVYGIQGIPTLLLVRDGQIVDRFVGAMPEHYLRAKLTHYL